MQPLKLFNRFSPELSPEHRWTKWATNFQVGHSALLLQLCPLLQPLSRAWPPTGRGCISLLTANTTSRTEISPKTLLLSARYLKRHLMSHLQIRQTAILIPYTEELGCGADLWFANLDFITTTSLLQPQHPAEGGGFAASWVNSSLFTTNHSPLSLSSYWHQTKSTQLLHWSDWEQHWLADKDLQEKFSSFKPGLYNMLGKGRMARFCPPVISQEPKLLEAQLQLPAARAASSAATKPFP